MYGGFVYNNPEVEALYMSCNSTLHARNSFGRQNYCKRKPPKSWKDDFSVLSVLLLIYELEVQIKMHTDIAYVYMYILLYTHTICIRIRIFVPFMVLRSWRLISFTFKSSNISLKNILKTESETQTLVLHALRVSGCVSSFVGNPVNLCV